MFTISIGRSETCRIVAEVSSKSCLYREFVYQPRMQRPQEIVNIQLYVPCEDINVFPKTKGSTEKYRVLPDHRISSPRKREHRWDLANAANWPSIRKLCVNDFRRIRLRPGAICTRIERGTATRRELHLARWQPSSSMQHKRISRPPSCKTSS